MFSFTGSRASFRGDVNFYGKSVSDECFICVCVHVLWMCVVHEKYLCVHNTHPQHVGVYNMCVCTHAYVCSVRVHVHVCVRVGVCVCACVYTAIGGQKNR